MLGLSTVVIHEPDMACSQPFFGGRGFWGQRHKSELWSGLVNGYIALF